MPNYDPTSPKVSEDFIAQDGEHDVQGHVYRNEDDEVSELRADNLRAVAEDDHEDVEGHAKVPRVAADEDDVEGHAIVAGALPKHQGAIPD